MGYHQREEEAHVHPQAVVGGEGGHHPLLRDSQAVVVEVHSNLIYK